MKYFLIALSVLLFSCAKSSVTEPALVPPAVDYSKYKIAKAIHVVNDVYDTTTYQYNSNGVTINVHYSDKTYPRYQYQFIKNSGAIISEVFQNGTKTMNGYYRILSNGNINSVANVRVNNTVNNTGKYSYDVSGRNNYEMVNFVTYQNEYVKNYTNGNFSYWIYNNTNFSNPSSNKRDSIVFEHHLDKPQHVIYKGQLQDLYGKQPSHLVKKRSYYNAGNIVYQTWEYAYETDSLGLVTKEVWNVFNQPGAILNRTDTTWFSYIKQ